MSEVKSGTPQSGAGWRPRLSMEAAFVPTLLIALIVLLSILSPVYFSGRNFTQILVQGSIIGMAAVGATFVIIGGDLDLSIGANVLLSGVMTATAMANWNLNWIVAVGVGILTSLVIGAANGLLSAYLKVPAFIATLGTGVVATGVSIYLTKGLTISGLPPEFGALAKTVILGIPSLVWFMLLVFIVGGVILHFTNFGVRVFAVGGNQGAAYLSGIPVAGIRLTNFLIAGLCAGIAGILLTARVQAGSSNISTTLTLYATAAVILGGTSILGGSGSMLRTFLAILLIAVVQNGLDILGIDYALQQVAVGAVFILAACSEALRRRK